MPGYSFASDADYLADAGCELCMNHTDECGCEECPKCEQYGDPECYGGKCSGLSDRQYGAMSKDMEERVNGLRERFNRRGKPKGIPDITPEEFFKSIGAPMGDFKWSDWGGYCDPIPWECGEKDCPVQWHQAIYCCDMGRKDGKLYLEIHSSMYMDGDWEVDEAWYEGKPDESNDFNYVNKMFHSTHGQRYFEAWFNYWMYCASTGTDVLEQYTGDIDVGNNDKWREFCLKSAESELEYLEREERNNDC